MARNAGIITMAADEVYKPSPSATPDAMPHVKARVSVQRHAAHSHTPTGNSGSSAVALLPASCHSRGVTSKHATDTIMIKELPGTVNVGIIIGGIR